MLILAKPLITYPRTLTQLFMRAVWSVRAPCTCTCALDVQVEGLCLTKCIISAPCVAVVKVGDVSVIRPWTGECAQVVKMIHAW